MVKSPDSTAANRLAVSGWIGLKAATRVPVAGPAQRVEFHSGLAREGHAGQRIQETTVGGNLGVAPEIGDALGHWTPPRLLIRPVFGQAEHLELARIVDGRLDPEHVGVVVELDRVGLEAEAHPAAL